MHAEQPEAPDISLPLLQRKPQTGRQYRGHHQSTDSIFNSRCLQKIWTHPILPIIRSPLENVADPSTNSHHTTREQFLSQSRHRTQLSPENEPPSSVNTCNCIHAVHSFFYALHLCTLAQTSIQFLKHTEAPSEGHGEWLHECDGMIVFPVHWQHFLLLWILCHCRHLYFTWAFLFLQTFYVYSLHLNTYICTFYFLHWKKMLITFVLKSVLKIWILLKEIHLSYILS